MKSYKREERFVASHTRPHGSKISQRYGRPWGFSTFSSAKRIRLRRHAAQLVTNNVRCMVLRLLSGIWRLQQWLSLLRDTALNADQNVGICCAMSHLPLQIAISWRHRDIPFDRMLLHKGDRLPTLCQFHACCCSPNFGIVVQQLFGTMQNRIMFKDVTFCVFRGSAFLYIGCDRVVRAISWIEIVLKCCPFGTMPSGDIS